MRFIPTKVHGVLDYLVGAALIVAPWLFGFAGMGGPAVVIPIVQAALTDPSPVVRSKAGEAVSDLQHFLGWRFPA